MRGVAVVYGEVHVQFVVDGIFGFEVYVPKIGTELIEAPDGA